MHVMGETTEELVQGCIRAKEEGYTAVGHLTPFLDEPRARPYFKTHAAKIADAIDTVRRYREAVGNEVDLCVEIHRRLTPAEAVVLGRGIEPFHPYFYEDPTLPDNMDSMAEIARKIGIPIATGERLHTMAEFEMLLRRDAVQYVRPDVCLAGGITHSKKIAALAEASGVGVVPHNPLSPVSTAACIQIAAAIPNFALQECPRGEDEPPKSEIVRRDYRMEKGFIIIPDTPGIGAELVDGAERKHPFKPRVIETRLHEDGSVFDQ
jgi:galactonate dehydratase